MPLRAAAAAQGRRTCSSTAGFRYGDLVEFNVLDTRQYRSPQVTGNERFDPARTILGAEQEAWLLGGARPRTGTSSPSRC